MGASDTIQDLHEADRSVAENLASHRHRPSVRMLGKLSELADQPQLAAICVLVAALGIVRRDRRAAATGGLMLAAHGLATLGKTILKREVNRTRPRVALKEDRYEARRGKSDDGDDQSFPSGHTAGAVATATVVAIRHPSVAAPAFLAASVASAIQVPRGKHYPTDLAAGVAIGTVAAGAVLAASVLSTYRRSAGR